jgi:hypothetical protein
MNLGLIAQQISRMFELFTNFTTELREAMANLMRLFTNLHTVLRRLENNLSMRIGPPIVQFTDALGEIFGLPYQVCQQWGAFRQMLGVLLTDKQGKAQVDLRQFLIMNAIWGRLLTESSWNDSIREYDHLSMSMVLGDLNGRKVTASIEDVKCL